MNKLPNPRLNLRDDSCDQVYHVVSALSRYGEHFQSTNSWQTKKFMLCDEFDVYIWMIVLLILTTVSAHRIVPHCSAKTMSKI